MGHEDGHRSRDSARDGGKSKENRKREHKDEKYDRDGNYSWHGEDYHHERKSEISHNGKIRAASKETSKQEEKDSRYKEGMDQKLRSRKDARDIANDRDRHRHRDKTGKLEDESLDVDIDNYLDESKEGRHSNERIKDVVYERNRQRHKDKADRHGDDSADVLEEVKSGKHLDGIEEGRHADERVKDSVYERDRHRHRDKASKYEEDLLDAFEDSSGGKRLDGFKEKSKKSSDKDLKMETDWNCHKDANREADHDHYHSGHKDTRKEVTVGEIDRDHRHHGVHRDTWKDLAGDGVHERHERKERPQKRKEHDDDTALQVGDRHLKRMRESVDSEKPILDDKVKGEKRKHFSEPSSSAVTAVDPDANLKSQRFDNGKPVFNNKRDANGVSSVSTEHMVPTKDFQHVLPVVTQVTSNIAGPFPTVSSNAPTSIPVSLGLETSEASTRDDSKTLSKSGAGGSLEGVKTSTLSLDALLKAKKALQMQKDLSEKLKKLPQLNKGVTQSSAALITPAAPPLAASGAATTSILSAPAVQNALPVSVNTFMSGVMPGMPGVLPNLGTISNYEAVKRAQEYVVRLGFQQPPGSMSLLGVVPPQGSCEAGTPSQPKTVKAPVLRLDAHGREIDEHGNIVDCPKVANVSTLKVNINKQKKEAFQILHPELDEDPVSLPHFDPRMGIDRKKLVRPKRSSFQFVEEGKWSKQAEILRLNSQFGEAKAKEIKAKQAVLAKAKAEADINPNLIEVVERIPVIDKPLKDPIPDVEWWDAILLLSGAYKDITEGELKVKMEKFTIYVEHPVPIEPPAESLPPPPQPLKLTKKEQKKLRTQRRLAKEKEAQEMIRQGLLEPPKPKVKMSNLMKVLGAEATQDPTRLEQEIRTAAAEREQAHTDRNLARKLTPSERQEKKEKKLFDDPNTLETIVSVYRVNDLSHTQLRFKVDVNAQENRLTGCVVMCDALSVVIVEGGSKSIKRYSKLMLKRINWASVVKEDDHGEEDKPHRINKCSLVWQGSVAKPAFGKFLIQQCRTEVAARKILADAGVAHYWDLAVNFSDE